MHFISKLFIITTFTISFAGAKISPFVPKFPMTGLLYVSQDAQKAYYLKNSGDITLIKNSKSFTILSGSSESTVSATISNTEKRIAFEVDPNSFTNFNIRKNNSLYISDFGSEKVELIGEGRGPRLHLEDMWFSYFDYVKSTLEFIFIPDKNKKITIKLNNGNNPYFLPSTLMPNMETIIYNDLNNQGFMALMSFSSTTNRFDLLLKSSTLHNHFEFCMIDRKIIIGDFTTEANGTNRILVGNVDEKNFQKNLRVVYQDKDPHIGSLQCSLTSQKVFFIKSFSAQDRAIAQTDVMSLDILKYVLKKITNNANVTDLFPMGNYLMTTTNEGLSIITDEVVQ